VVFSHADPTGVGFVELGLPLVLRLPDEESWLADCRDGLVFVRLHDEPLGFARVVGARGALSSEQIAAAIWQELAGAIGEHCARFGCGEPASSVEQLVAGLGSPAGGCRGALSTSDTPVTVVIPTASRAVKLERCLESLCDLRYPSFDVIVVDNHPHVPGSEDVVRAFNDRLTVRYIPEPRPGSSVARNRGLVEASSEIVAFADDDAVVDANWLGWLVEPFTDPEVVGVGGMILPLELHNETQKVLEHYYGGGVARDFARRVYDLGPNRASDRFLYPYWGAMFGSGPSMAFRRGALLDVGALDPALGAGSPARAGEDIEAFTAVILHGGRVVHQPRAICWHEHTEDMTYLRGQLFNFAAGLTAISVKYLRDPRFLAAAARSIPYLFGRRRTTVTPLDADIVPLPMHRELVRATHTGLFKGPLLYARSRRWARRQNLYDVIKLPPE
jgi:cellulose synthase/poly-beta-1,6-N-acetylglucosamine synthase-like glycosyltransferase